MDKVTTLRLLFVCQGSSFRSRLAEGWCRHLVAQLPPFLAVEVAAAGIDAAPLDPAVIAAMAACGVEVETRPSGELTVDQLAAADLVVTLSSAAETRCPDLPAGTRKLHLPFADPAPRSSDEAQLAAGLASLCEEIRLAVAGLLQELTLQQLARVDGQVFDQSDVRVLSREPAYNGFIPVEVLQLQHRLFAGGWSESVRRELAVRPPAVGVLLYDPQRDEVVMVKQFRTGALDAGHSPWMLEIVAGLADPDEAPIDVVRREAREEANCEISEAIPICDYLNSPGWCNERVSLFCARVDAGTLQGIHGLDAEHEDILVVTLSLQKAVTMLTTGEINNAMSIIALQWLQLNRDRLRR